MCIDTKYKVMLGDVAYHGDCCVVGMLTNEREDKTREAKAKISLEKRGESGRAWRKEGRRTDVQTQLF